MSNRTVYDQKQRAGMLKELLNNAALVWKLLLDPRVSILAKLIPAAALVYLISPVDLVPDMFPVLGQLDDLAIIMLAIRAFIALSPPELVQWHRSNYGGSAPTTNEENAVDGTYRVMDE